MTPTAAASSAAMAPSSRPNLQLHLKTDKHAQKYQLAAHLRRGGAVLPPPQCLWEMGLLMALSPPCTSRCNICDFESNSKEKMRLHARGGP